MTAQTQPDLIAEWGAACLGSRLKRLGERLQAEAARVTQAAGLSVQPAHVAVLAAISRQPMSVGELADLLRLSQPGVTRSLGQLVEQGLVQSERGSDERRRNLTLTAAGKATVARLQTQVWPRLAQAVDELCGGDAADLLAGLTMIEAGLATESLDRRAARALPGEVTILPWHPDRAGAFHDINREWIEAMFAIEPADLEVLEDPQGQIIAPGGDILFAEAAGLGVVGAGALRRGADGAIELTKMGVLEAARGLKAGEKLLAALIERGRDMGATPLYLLTNKRCEAAIHLYEKLGFVHDPAIMERFGGRYCRCDVAMRLPE